MSSIPLFAPPFALETHTVPILCSHDTELTDLVPFLTDLSTVDDVRSVLDAGLYQHLAQQQNGTDDVFNQI